MITTKRYDYVPFDRIGIHPDLGNHRRLDPAKVEHYAVDIQRNGLLEPLIVWERNHYEFFLVGGFHRMAAIRSIREKNPGFFDRVDVRVVNGSLDEMRALNLKLNADRLDAKLTDYFDSVIYLNNANWAKEQIAEFLDKPVALIEDMLRFVPTLDGRLRGMLEAGRVSWSRCKAICREVLAAAPGTERDVLEGALAALEAGGAARQARPLTLRKAVKRLGARSAKHPQASYHVSGDDIMALLLLLKGRDYRPEHVERVRAVFPGLLEEE